MKELNFVKEHLKYIELNGEIENGATEQYKINHEIKPLYDQFYSMTAKHGLLSSANEIRLDRAEVFLQTMVKNDQQRRS